LRNFEKMDTCNRESVSADQLKKMNIVIVGHVDHGKSTVIGRLLADTNSLPKGKLEAVRELCRRTAKPFEYAFLLDALKDERSQGITIDTARCFFQTQKRKYIIIDAPGHIEFLKNMITGASRAQAALLVIDAHEGIRENSLRHGYMLAMLGIKQIAVLVNKLDLIEPSRRREVYENIKSEYERFLEKIELRPASFIPVSAAESYNISSKCPQMPWYGGPTVLEALDAFEEEPEPEGLPFRMWVQDVYKFTAGGDERRIVAGTVSSGVLREGAEIMFMPSGKKTFVKSIEVFNEPPKSCVRAGYAAGFCMAEQIYAKRGELVTLIGETPPSTGTCVKASVFWLGKEPFIPDKNYRLKIGSAQVSCRLDEVLSVLNASTLENESRGSVERNEVARCVLRFDRPLAFDLAGGAPDTSRFVIVDGYEIAGGGIITSIPEGDTLSEKLVRRNIKWIKSDVSTQERERYYRQKAQLVVISGHADTDKKGIARCLERQLLDAGRTAYYLGIGNLLYGVDSDIKSDSSMHNMQERREHIRRLGELSNIMLDAGNILIVTASELAVPELELLRQIIQTENIITVWVGDVSRQPPGYDACVHAGGADTASEIFRMIEAGQLEI